MDQPTKTKNLETATLLVSPMSSSSNKYYKTINIQFNLMILERIIEQANKSEIELLKNRVLNWDIAKIGS